MDGVSPSSRVTPGHARTPLGRNARGLLPLTLAFALAACGNDNGTNGGDLAGADSSSADSAVFDLSGADMTTGSPYDLANADLAGYSDVGGPCGGFTSMPKQCLPWLVCVLNQIPDAPGRCEYPDGGSCVPNGSACTGNDQCCSGNCILRTNPGYCCVPGGCP